MSFFDSMIYIILGLCFALCSCNRSEEATGRDRFRSVSDRQALSEGKSVPSGSHDAMLQSPDFSRESSRAQNAYRLTGEWDGLSREFSGEELLAKQKELALRAVGELGAGPELLQFLDYLTERGAGDVREWVLNEGTEGLFSGVGAAEARAWLLTVEDEGLRKRFLRQPGEEWVGSGFQAYLTQWDHS